MSRHLDHSDRAKIIERFLAGETYEAICSEVDYTIPGAKAVVQRARNRGIAIPMAQREPFTLVEIEAVLDHWAAGLKECEVGSATGLEPAQVRHIVALARTRGDARAARRMKPFVRPSEDRRRRRAETEALKEQVLNDWDNELTAKQIAHRQRISPEYVQSIVKIARADGDARARRRKAV